MFDPLFVLEAKTFELKKVQIKEICLRLTRIQNPKIVFFCSSLHVTTKEKEKVNRQMFLIHFLTQLF